MTTERSLSPGRRALSRVLAWRSHEAVVLAFLLVEIAVFSAIGTRFATVDNALEVLRISSELGLLALALTLVIVSGGIDLSIGSLMGLAAVVTIPTYLIYFAVQPLPSDLVALQIGYDTIAMVILGVVTAAVNRDPVPMRA